MGYSPPREPSGLEEAETISAWVNAHSPEQGEVLCFILSSGARIDETLHLRADKVFVGERQVELLGKGG